MPSLATRLLSGTDEAHKKTGFCCVLDPMRTSSPIAKLKKAALNCIGSVHHAAQCTDQSVGVNALRVISM